MDKDESVIPEGFYCYTGWGDSFKPCPYWSRRENKPEQQNGYCSFLDRSDWQEGLSLLWDQVKECGINEGDWEKEFTSGSEDLSA